MIKVYKENVVLSISEEQLTEYTKKGFKEVGKKEVTHTAKIAKLEEKVNALETEKAKLEEKVNALETKKTEANLKNPKQEK